MNAHVVLVSLATIAPNEDAFLPAVLLQKDIVDEGSLLMLRHEFHPRPASEPEFEKPL